MIGTECDIYVYILHIILLIRSGQLQLRTVRGGHIKFQMSNFQI